MTVRRRCCFFLLGPTIGFDSPFLFELTHLKGFVVPPLDLRIDPDTVLRARTNGPEEDFFGSLGGGPT